MIEQIILPSNISTNPFARHIGTPFEKQLHNIQLSVLGGTVNGAVAELRSKMGKGAFKFLMQITSVGRF